LIQYNIFQEGKGHTGTKASKVVFIDKRRVFTCGFSKMSDRQCAIWNIVSVVVHYSAAKFNQYYPLLINFSEVLEVFNFSQRREGGSLIYSFFFLFKWFDSVNIGHY